MSEGPTATLHLGPAFASVLASRHPWIYRDALPRHGLQGGELVRVEAGPEVAFGLYDAAGAIGVRLVTWGVAPHERWWEAAIERAVAARAPLREAGHTAYRLVFGEGDGLPGLVADRYGRHAVVELHAAALEGLLPRIAKALLRAARLKGVVRRVDGDLEVLAGEAPPPEVTVREHGLRFLANLREGQKTGLFLDHREHRRRIRDRAEGARVLNLFGYAGGFSVAALAGGAREAWTVDVAGPALRDADRNVAANALDPARHRAVEADVFALLPDLAAAGERFDLVILDPPSLARRKAQRARAVRAYRRLNAGAASLLAPGGVLATASCTAQVAPAAFEAAVRGGLEDAGVDLRLAERGRQPLDHPVLPTFPEGRYLKCLVFEAPAP